jgi:hypothetical protein
MTLIVNDIYESRMQIAITRGMKQYEKVFHNKLIKVCMYYHKEYLWPACSLHRRRTWGDYGGPNLARNLDQTCRIINQNGKRIKI